MDFDVGEICGDSVLVELSITRKYGAPIDAIGAAPYL